jgi:chromate transporter
LKGWRHLLIAAGAALLFGLNINPIWVILIAGTAGWVLFHSQAPVAMAIAPRSLSATNNRWVLSILSLAAVGFALLFLFWRGLFDLAALFFRIDLFAFGGGFASVPLMYHEIVDARHWLDSATFLNGIALGQVTPGPIVITATFIGYLLKGPIGGILATMGIFLPSFTLVIGLAPYFDRLRASKHFYHIIQGILCSFVGLLLSVTIQFASRVQWDIIHGLLAVIALAALLLKVDILWVVLAGILASVLLIH